MRELGPDPRTVADLLARAGDPAGFEAWRARGRSAGWCSHPVRLVGTSHRYTAGDGELVGTFSSRDLPDHVLLKACGQRRATRCPSCSATYRSDAFQLVAAGLRGGKGVPETVACHPALFATFTAPSFGAVHSTRDVGGHPRPCRPHGDGVCSHGRARGCAAVHEHDDPEIGSPLCLDCFDYEAAVLWNALAGELWRRTTIGIRRALAALAGLPVAELRDHVRLSFTKVVEYQRRGVVHLHAVIRLDDAHQGDAPPSSFDLTLLTCAVQRAATAVAVRYPATPGVTGLARWGSQLDLRGIGGDDHVVPGVVAAYLAKYATKSTDAAGLLDHRLRETDLEDLHTRLTPHVAQMVTTAWTLGARPELDELRLRAWSHTLGFRGHWLTKSRAYSTSFAALRAARNDWHKQRERAERPAEDTLVSGSWRFAGRGWTTSGDAWLAQTAAASTAEARRLAAEQRRAERRHGNQVDQRGTDL